MRTAQDDFDPLTDLSHIEYDGTNSFVRMVALTGDLLAARQDRVGLTQVYNDRPAFEPLHGAGDQVGPLIFELIKEAVALGLSDFLDDDLLCRLRRYSSQLRRVHPDTVLGRFDRSGIGV